VCAGFTKFACGRSCRAVKGRFRDGHRKRGGPDIPLLVLLEKPKRENSVSKTNALFSRFREGPTNKNKGSKVKKILAIIGLAAATLAGAQAQLVFFSFNTDLTANEDTITGIPTMTQNGGDALASASWAAGTAFTDSSGTSWAAGNAMTWSGGVNSGTDAFVFSFNATGYENFTVRFDYRATATGPVSFSSVQYRVGGSGAFSNISGATLSLTNDSTFHAWSLDLSTLSAIEDVSNVELQWTWTSGSGSGTARIDNFQLTGAPVPEPKTWALIGIGSSFMLWNLRRRRVQA